MVKLSTWELLGKINYYKNSMLGREFKVVADPIGTSGLKLGDVYEVGATVSGIFNLFKNDWAINSMNGLELWEEIDYSVGFTEAFNALSELGKDIYCEFEGQRHFFLEKSTNTHHFSEDMISSGKWYVVEGE